MGIFLNHSSSYDMNGMQKMGQKNKTKTKTKKSLGGQDIMSHTESKLFLTSSRAHKANQTVVASQPQTLILSRDS